MAAEPRWTYMLRIPHRNPSQIRMDRLAEYMREFAQLLGVENQPVFAGIKNASVGLRAKVPAKHRNSAWKRVQAAKSLPDSKPARHLHKIESMLGEDAFSSAELKDNSDKVVYLFQPKEQTNMYSASIKQHGEIDGVVTGIVGADDTMHLHVRDALSRDLRLVVKDEALARDLLTHFRHGHVRLRVHGVWVRTEDGWIPETSRCTVDGYELLDETPACEVFERLASAPGNGWCELPDPMGAWRELRGIN